MEESLRLETEAGSSTEPLRRDRRERRRVPRRLRRPFGAIPRYARRSEREIPEGRPSTEALRRDARYRRSLAVADLAAAATAVLVGIPFLGEDSVDPIALLAIPLILLVSKVTGLYDRDENLLRKTTLDEVPTLFRVATLYAFLIWLAGDNVVEGTFGREQAVVVWLLLFGSMVAFRAGARSAVRHVSSEERCLLIGHPDAAAWVAKKLDQAPSLKARVVGRISLGDESLEPEGGLSYFGGLDSLGPALLDQDIDRAIIAPNGTTDDQILDAIRRVKTYGMKVSVLPRLFEVVGSSVEFDEIDGMTLLGVRRHGLTRSSTAIKRGFDVFGATIGIVVLGPLLALIAVAIKLDTPGPVFFRQRRVGRADEPFEMLKFRTMVDGAEAQKSELAAMNEAEGGLFKIQLDPRITRVGSFLRATSLDELPQLFNVLRGEMSLVGPRPLVIDEDARIGGLDRRRLLLPPGMTGLWQVFGSARIPMPEMVKIDYLYGANWSLWLDIKILLRTVPFVLGRRGL